MQQQTSEHGDQNRTDVNEHHRGTGIDRALGRVEGDVIEAKPEHNASSESDVITTGRSLGRRNAASAPRVMLPISNRSSEGGPVDKAAPAARMPTNADAQSTTLTIAAPSPSASCGRGLGGGFTG